jgi:hypothetical protein
MNREKILLTVLTYPQPSVTYEENFCTAGFREDGSLIRIYPVAFSRYNDLHKYTYIELSIKKRRKGDFRPESFSPTDFNLKDMKVLNKISTENGWSERKNLCLKNVYNDFDKLISDSKGPKNISLAVFKPKEILDFGIKEISSDWKSSWLAKMDQLKLFDDGKNKIRLEKIPYEFKYHFTDINNKIHKLQILDWEIGTLYRNCVKAENGNKEEALKKVKEKYFEDFTKRDIYFFLGTTLEWHIRRARNPFVIIGIFYPPKTSQTTNYSLF